MTSSHLGVFITKNTIPVTKPVKKAGETALAIRRAGAEKIITYYAGEAAKWLRQK